ncbi:MAG: multidrug ABC transporter ATP-binding protein [Burkholderiales bacterium RIFCSPLOWO2_02_FULL_57_36]|nr:MAG: multidrug ABC transporter ATP-binding protein [Burkholderiales bacterium RIFCSPLOWO2_02_FULL_57_36]
MTDTAANPIIDVRGLTKRYGGRTVVDHFDMRVPQGRIYGFLGPNGSGKTTTIRILCGLLTPDEGEGTCLGYDIRREAQLIKRQVGYMTQKFGLYEDLSIEENLAFIARVYEVPGRNARIKETLERLGLTGRRTQLAGALSGGWKQRLALAACLLHEPRLLLLDEPTAGVDPKARREFWDQLHELADAGLTVLVSTHYMDEAERCHELAYISYGRLLAQGTAAELIAHTGLATCEISGSGLTELAKALRPDPLMKTVASFGAALHVSAASIADIDAALAPYRASGITIKRIDPSLEDVFIALMQDAKDNYAEGGA